MPKDCLIKDVLQAKIKGEELTADQINSLVSSITDGAIDPAQVGAFLMLVFLKGMTNAETVLLTMRMRDSGFCFSWPDSWVVADKHSTGGVGDKVSLILAPALASRGLKVPMISGRSLGHTGGTLDKLESIPDFRVNLSESEIKEALANVGCCIVGQTGAIVPADKVMYATRDITSTVGCIPLIVSSILSKKASEGLDGLVLDVKYGCGSFMESEEEADCLAEALVGAAKMLDLPCTALVTDMRSPLGRNVGNSLEIIESIECLKGKGPSDLEELVVNLGGELLMNTGMAATLDEGKAAIHESLRDQSALRTFRLMMENQGVSKENANDLCNLRYNCLPAAKNKTEIFSTTSGYVSAIDAKKIAILCQKLGANRAIASDVINFGVGIALNKVLGDEIDSSAPWITIYHDAPLCDSLRKLANDALTVDSNKIPLSKSRISKRIF